MHRCLPWPADGLPALATDAWFGACPAAFQRALLADAQLWPLADGQSLFERGAPADGLCCVVEGGLGVGQVHADGQVSLLAWLGPCQWFGEISLIDGLPRTHDAVADGDTVVLVAPREPLLAWLADHPVHWRELARLACRKLRTAFEVMGEPGQWPLPQRLARRLWWLARGYGSRPAAPGQRIRLSQAALAQMLGVSRQSVNPALRLLAARGLIRLHYGEIEVLDPPQLQAFSAGSAGPVAGAGPGSAGWPPPLRGP